MNTLTIEQKAKAYDEALERANSCLGSNQLGDAWIYKILPELVESEDEKIRKGLIGYFSDFHLQTFAGLDPKKILAWLEKRDEQKPKKCMFSNDDYTDEERKVLCEGCGEDCKFKQKAAESPTFKDKLLELFQKFRYIKDDVPTNGDIINYVDTHIQELIDTIQKPVEWSEEDAMRLDNAITQLKAASNIIVDDEVDDSIAFIKSLKDRSTWKPSDEQIYALRSVVTELKHSDNKYQETIEDLYNDLEKLRKE